jgi:hypothetical protein
MKLRIKGNSLRFRVSRSEVARLLAADPLVETIQFAPEAGARFTYALQREPSVTIPTVRYTQNKVAVLLPADQADAWGGYGSGRDRRRHQPGRTRGTRAPD